MNASVAIVIVGDEKNISLPWRSDFESVLLTDELAAGNDQTYSKCNYFGRVSTTGTTLSLTLMLLSFSYMLTVGFQRGAIERVVIRLRSLRKNHDVDERKLLTNVGCQKGPYKHVTKL